MQVTKDRESNESTATRATIVGDTEGDRGGDRGGFFLNKEKDIWEKTEVILESLNKAVFGAEAVYPQAICSSGTYGRGSGLSSPIPPTYPTTPSPTPLFAGCRDDSWDGCKAEPFPLVGGRERVIIDDPIHSNPLPGHATIRLGRQRWACDCLTSQVEQGRWRSLASGDGHVQGQGRGQDKDKEVVEGCGWGRRGRRRAGRPRGRSKKHTHPGTVFVSLSIPRIDDM